MNDFSDKAYEFSNDTETLYGYGSVTEAQEFNSIFGGEMILMDWNYDEICDNECSVLSDLIQGLR